MQSLTKHNDGTDAEWYLLGGGGVRNFYFGDEGSIVGRGGHEILKKTLN